MLVENACLTLLATALALLIARVSLPAVLAWLPAIPRVDAAAVDFSH